MESENENQSSKEESVPQVEAVPQEPDFKSLLVQVDKLESELENERKKNAEQISRMKYLQADLLNMQKQADRMVSDVRNQIRQEWILEIISIKEDLDRALKSTSSENTVLIKGLKLVASRIENDLKSELVEQINVEVGAKFDPKYHEAVSSRETDENPEGSVLSVIANGYTIIGKVLKPAMVEVARKKTPPAPEEPAVEASKAAPRESPEAPEAAAKEADEK